MTKSKKSKGAKPGLAPILKRSPGHLLQRAAQLAADAYARAAGSGAVTQRQYAVLAAVHAAEAPSQSELVRLTGIDRSTLADMASRMIAKGLLERERSTADARANVVRLSEAGHSALEAARPHVEAADQHILSMLGPRKRAAFVKALSKVTRAEFREAMEAGAADAAKPEPAKERKSARNKPVAPVEPDDLAALD